VRGIRLRGGIEVGGRWLRCGRRCKWKRERNGAVARSRRLRDGCPGQGNIGRLWMGTSASG